MTNRNRPQLTVKHLVEFLDKCNPDAVVYIAPSLVNLDEPEKTQEFIDWEEKKEVVAIETVHIRMSVCTEVTIGYK